MNTHLTTTILAGTLALLAQAATAQQTEMPENIERLQNMQSTGTTSFQQIAQDGPFADGIRATLERIEMPEGFKIELYAVVPDARHMAVGP